MSGDRMSAADYRALVANAGNASGRVARGRKKPDGMNKLERRYADFLNSLMPAGLVVWWRFEALKLRLADNTFLTVDFFLMTGTGDLEAHETKGFMRDDAAVKLKVAAEMFPFRFYLVKDRAEDGGGFSVVEVGA